MIRFADGPAIGITLTLRRAPLFLRAVRSGRGGWDALDQLHDECRASETPYAYRRIGPASRWRLKSQRRGQSGWFVAAEYRLCDPQPTSDDMRDTESWRAWCLEQQSVEVQS